MEGKHYTCRYCYGEFVPTRRHVQKFCSNSCRSKAHHIKNRNSNTLSIEQPPKTEAIKADKMTMAGIGNATAGSLAAEALKSMLTAQDNKPATKGDIKMLYHCMERFHRVGNMPMRADGHLPFFDLQTKQLVYFQNTLLAKIANNNHGNLNRP